MPSDGDDGAGDDENARLHSSKLQQRDGDEQARMLLGLHKVFFQSTPRTLSFFPVVR